MNLGYGGSDEVAMQGASAGYALNRPFNQRERLEMALKRHKDEAAKIEKAIKLLDENPTLNELLNLMSTINC